MNHLGSEEVEVAIGSALEEKVLLEILQNSQKNTCARVSFLIKLQILVCNFIKKETLAQVFSGEFCKTSKNTFVEHLLGTFLKRSFFKKTK